jgi:hypothetical protein
MRVTITIDPNDRHADCVRDDAESWLRYRARAGRRVSADEARRSTRSASPDRSHTARVQKPLPCQRAAMVEPRVSLPRTHRR